MRYSSGSRYSSRKASIASNSRSTRTSKRCRFAQRPEKRRSSSHARARQSFSPSSLIRETISGSACALARVTASKKSAKGCSLWRTFAFGATSTRSSSTRPRFSQCLAFHQCDCFVRIGLIREHTRTRSRCKSMMSGPEPPLKKRSPAQIVALQVLSSFYLRTTSVWAAMSPRR